MPETSEITVAVIYPELLGLYSDRGNAIALRHRAAVHGMKTTIIDVGPGDALPASADIYLLGGAEDAAMVMALGLLREQPTLSEAPDRGAVVLAVCAGFQLLGHSFTAPDGSRLEGLGLLDITSHRLETRAVGEILVDSPLLGELQGFENHQGDAQLGPGVTPLGTVLHGVGNGHHRTEGAVQGRVLGTYLHGPALARNPAFVDHVLELSTGRELPPAPDALIEEMRSQRRAVMLGRASDRGGLRLRRP